MKIWKYENIFSKPTQFLRTTKYYISTEILLEEGTLLDALRKDLVPTSFLERFQNTYARNITVTFY